MIDEKNDRNISAFRIKSAGKNYTNGRTRKKKKLNAYSNLQEILRIDCDIGAFDEVIREIDAMIKERRG